MRCKSRVQSGTGRIQQCTREAGHPVIEETIPYPEGYRPGGIGELKYEFTRLVDGHMNLLPGHRVRWPDRAAMADDAS